jgi:hypothetical protein
MTGRRTENAGAMDFGRLASRIIMLVACLVCGVAAGRGDGVAVLTGVIMGAALLVASKSPVWAGIAYLGVMSVFGAATLLSLGGIPDVTVERAAAAWLLVALTVHASRRKDGGDGPRLPRVVGAAIAVLVTLTFLAALRASVLTTGLQVWLDQYVIRRSCSCVYRHSHGLATRWTQCCWVLWRCP